MVSPVDGWTIGIATWLESKPHWGFKLWGEKLSGSVDQTHLVRKLMASWLIELCCLSSLGIRTKLICGTQSGVAAWCGDHLGVDDRGNRIGHHGTTQVMAGTLPEIFVRVTCECVHYVHFKFCFIVGFGAAMIRGALVMRRRGWMAGAVALCSTGAMSTLCLWGVTA